MLILFAGYDRSGKDTAYTTIKEMEATLPFKSVQRIALADHLKKVGHKVFGVTETMKDTGAEEYYRMCLTKTSEIMKIAAGSATYFAEYLIKSIGLEKLCASDALYTCTDGRYDYEICYFGMLMAQYTIKNRLPDMFFPIKVTRPGIPPTAYAMQNHNFREYRNFFKCVTNVGIENYKQQIQDTVREILNTD